MKNKLPLSALLSGLLATPLLAGPPVLPPRQDAGGGGQAIPMTFSSAFENLLLPAEMTRFEDQLRLVNAGHPLDAHGMQQLQRQMTAAVNDHLNRVIATQDQLAKNPHVFQIQTASPAAPGAIHTEKAAFLGITSSPVSPILREQLNIPHGMGLVVDYVEKDSPADVAGLKVHDILQKLDDQWLINPQQLAVLVRSKKPGDTLTLTVLHGGQPATLSAKLVEKDLVPLDNLQEPGVFTNPNFQLVPMPPIPPSTGSPLGSTDGPTLPGGSNMTLSRSDGDHLITIHADEKGRTLAVTDLHSGQFLYSGAFNGDDDLKTLDPAVAEKVRTLLKKATINGNVAHESINTQPPTQAPQNLPHP